MTDTEPALVALDWGTSGRRAWLLDAGGRILDTRRSGRGLLATTDGIDAHDRDARAAAHEAALHEACGDWLTAYPQLPAVACGMVGSDRGWADSGYRTVPATVDFTALVPVRHRGGVLHLVPGLRIPSGEAPGDVMRGEETQLVGLLDALGDRGEPCTVVLPGTHTKWARVEGGRVTGFSTAMSGELYGLLTAHGILARTAETARTAASARTAETARTAGSARTAETAAGSVRRDDAAFERGLAAGRSRGLAAELFAARPLVLDGVLAPAALPDYLSGVLIADEVAHLLPGAATEVVLCGTADLCRRYATALARHGVRATVLSEDITARGLWRIADQAGLLGRHDEEVPDGRPTR
ncbi:2-dehydro-3-deoxygalactonokinase [Streptomyces sp. B-S-A8]|uniref:2-dehydro-3-deoxygalactonokinase n=1 Tax=Streptomyces solicavernae TaxID=3043614 RepID=A0ABT6RL19_9ACTN|nr:2-dehydro-3-deoxygalactonokinase [Streptomyces sp. B-S-A8]MDI3385117.1 2-dehydro-3-deoxygalactonokinase [Streptomyces sp. B-S-A8]